MIETKYYCDICGKEMSYAEYFIVSSMVIFGTYTDYNFVHRKTDKELSVCGECKEKVNNYIKTLKTNEGVAE